MAVTEAEINRVDEITSRYREFLVKLGECCGVYFAVRVAALLTLCENKNEEKEILLSTLKVLSDETLGVA